jgi:hypothetical protein
MKNSNCNPSETTQSPYSLWRAIGFSAAILAALVAGMSFLPHAAQGQIPPQSPCPPTPPAEYHYCGRVGGQCDKQIPCNPSLYYWYKQTKCCHLSDWHECLQYVGEWWCCPPKDGVPAGWRSACIPDGVITSDRCLNGTKCEE